MRDSNDDDDLFGGNLPRDVGEADASAGESREATLNAFRIVEDEFKGRFIRVEQVKVRYQLRGHKKINDPEHWWGSWTLKAIDQKKLIPMDKTQPTVCRQSNKRKAAVYYVP